jgi:hypothetical protein
VTGHSLGPICGSRLPPDWIDQGTTELCRTLPPGLIGLSPETNFVTADGESWAQVHPPQQASRPAEPIRELSGAQWVDRFPTSTSLDTLAEPFRTNAQRFVDALLAAGATVRVSATLRPPERAYLMHYATRVASGKLSTGKVPARAGVDINWVHATNAESVSAAAAMVAGYGIVFPPALDSNHSRGTAIDMTISGVIGKTMTSGSGAAANISSQSDLEMVGASFGVLKLPTDPPHWSHDGH